MLDFVINQCWVSEMEPELGIGHVTEVSNRFVTVYFPSSKTSRTYARMSAPLKRLAFKTGETIRTKWDQTFVISDIEEINGIFIYKSHDKRIPEKDINTALGFSSPFERLLRHSCDSNQDFTMRVKTLKWKAKHKSSAVCGFMGARIDLIPHQIYVASQVTARHTPRVLLADQVGLGKTIEACLVLHRLLITGRVSRVLIIVPDSLVHQWFVELLRRFNLVCRIYDEEYFYSILKVEKNSNPLLKEQLILTSINFICQSRNRKYLVSNEKWDMVIIDEVHRFSQGTPQFDCLTLISDQTKSLLLLSGTPLQLGLHSHFSRLTLLDKSRYFDYQSFLDELKGYKKIADCVNYVIDQKNAIDIHFLNRKLSRLGLSVNENLNNKNERSLFVENLVDRYGLGRSMFRNTRAIITNFPQREVHFHPLKANDQQLKQQEDEFKWDFNQQNGDMVYDFKNDPRLIWLVSWLKRHKSKVLLICTLCEKAKAIKKALDSCMSISVALFHEQMTIIQRDRNAAWFADPEGAQLLICSEIGSEGRNFQFAHHLVLFDLPVDPEILEQRIGRLDRIGQKHTIHIDIPYLIGSPQEILKGWFHEGLNAFESFVPSAPFLYEKYSKAILNIAFEKDFKGCTQIIEKTNKLARKVDLQLQEGRDRLLELVSFDAEKADEILKVLQFSDQDKNFERFVLSLFDYYQVKFEDHIDNVYFIDFDHLTHPDFPCPAFRGEKIPVTFDRKTALKREDVEFVTLDHPMVSGAIDLLLGSEKGNAAFVLWESNDLPQFFLQAYFVVETICPDVLFCDRYLPPTLLLLVINQDGMDVTDEYKIEAKNSIFKSGRDFPHFKSERFRQKILPDLIKAGQESARQKADFIIAAKRKEMLKRTQAELDRLKYLQKINPNVTQKEIDDLVIEQQELREAFENARVRLDAARVIYKGCITNPPGGSEI